MSSPLIIFTVLAALSCAAADHHPDCILGEKYRQSGDCSGWYYVCEHPSNDQDHTVWQPKKCPADLVFSNTHLVCDYPKDQCTCDVIATPDQMMHVTVGGPSEMFYNATTDSSQVQLKCGEFTYATEPPFDVHWILPDGSEVHSNEYANGFYWLVVPWADAQEGTYRCELESPDWAKACITGDAYAEIDYVDTDAKFGIIENYLVKENVENKQRKEEVDNKISENKNNIQANSDKIDQCDCGSVSDNRAAAQLLTKEVEDLMEEVAKLKASRRRR